MLNIVPPLIACQLIDMVPISTRKLECIFQSGQMEEKNAGKVRKFCQSENWEPLY